jgi:hypothetical protein
MPELTKEQQEKADKEQKEFDAVWDEVEGEPDTTPPAGEEKDDLTPPEPKADEGQDKDTQQEKHPETPPAEETPPQDSPEVAAIKAELEKERQKTKSWEGRIRAANERAKAAEEEAERLKQERETKQVVPPAKPLSSDEEDTAVKAFEDEFPDLPKPILAMVRKNLMPMVETMISERVGKIESVVPKVEKLQKHIEVDAETAHYDAITKAHPDWETIVSSGELDKFIESQPSYVRKALEKVKANGETEEVIDMFSQYKLTNNKPKPVPPKTPVEDDPKDLLAVPASPGGPKTPKQGAAKDDFDGAWDEAVKSG